MLTKLHASMYKVQQKQLSSKTIGYLVGQKLPHILWNPNFHWRVNKSPVPIIIHIYPVQSVTHHPIPLRPCLLLFSYLCLGHPSGYFPLSIPNKTLYEFISPHVCYMPTATAVCLFLLPNNIWRGKPLLKFLFILSSLLLCSSS